MHENNAYLEHSDLLDEVIYENSEKDLQVRLTVSEFRGNYYLGMRRWVIDIDDSWMPTREGFTMPYNINTTSTLFSALTKVLSKAEVLKEVLEHSNFDLETLINERTNREISSDADSSS